MVENDSSPWYSRKNPAESECSVCISDNNEYLAFAMQWPMQHKTLHSRVS